MNRFKCSLIIKTAANVIPTCNPKYVPCSSLFSHHSLHLPPHIQEVIMKLMNMPDSKLPTMKPLTIMDKWLVKMHMIHMDIMMRLLITTWVHKTNLPTLNMLYNLYLSRHILNTPTNTESMTITPEM